MWFIGVVGAVDIIGIGGFIWFAIEMSTPSAPQRPYIPRLQ